MNPPLSNRTFLALADLIAACFEFSINLGGKFEERIRPDWLADFLYEASYPPLLVQAARFLQVRPGAIRYFVLGLGPRSGVPTPLAPSADGPVVTHDLLRKLAVDTLNYIKSDRCLVKPIRPLVERFVRSLELDGYDVRAGQLVVREENVFDVDEQGSALSRLFVERGLEASDQLAKDLRLTDEHYTAGDWGDSIKHARDVMETALLGVARAVAVEKQKNLSRTALAGPVRAFLKANAVISEEEEEFLFALYTILSVQGGHANMSEREHARICRQYALTAAHFILLRYDSIKGRASSTE